MTSTDTKSLNSDFWEKYSYAGYRSLLERYPIEDSENTFFGYCFRFSRFKMVKEYDPQAATENDTADQCHIDRGVEDPIVVGAASATDSKAEDRADEDCVSENMNLTLRDELFESIEDYIRSVSESIGTGTSSELRYCFRDDEVMLCVVVLVYRRTSRWTPKHLPTEALLKAWENALAKDIDDPECEPRFGWFTKL
ncbi:hypothetical protein QCA50_011249 [Cerrena zonata]|uniref:Uncharacterized protein n=1 Tax=Cerrena zonata TaxID=2478898 RepID=A0AAW0FWV0_9APHY